MTETRWAIPADAEDLVLILREMALHYRQAPLPKAMAAAAV